MFLSLTSWQRMIYTTSETSDPLDFWRVFIFIFSFRKWNQELSGTSAAAAAAAAAFD